MSTTTSQIEELSFSSNRSLTSLRAFDSIEDTIHNDESVPRDAIDAIPNGGYGWTVVFACSLITFLFNGWGSAWGVLQAALLQSRLSHVSTSTISFVGSLGLALCVLLGLFSVRITRLIGARNATLLGIILQSLGILLSSLTTDDIGGLFATSGVLIGLGSSLLYSIANTLPVQWFSTKLGTANGFVKLGGGLGATITAIAMQALLNKVGVAMTFRVLGFITLGSGILAAFLIKERVPPGSAPFVDLSLFRSVPFCCLFLAGAVGTFALFVPPYFLPLFAHSIGLSASTGAAIVAAFNGCTAIGRFGAGFACDKLGPTNMLLLVMSLNAFSMFAIWPVSTSIGPLILFAAINGMANGGYFVAMPTTIATMIGPGRAPIAMGMSITGWTGGYLLGSPLAGILIAASGAADSSSVTPYRAAIFYAGGVALASSGFVLIARLTMDPKLIKKL